MEWSVGVGCVEEWWCWLRRSAPWARAFRFPAWRWEELAPVGRSYMGFLGRGFSLCRAEGKRGAWGVERGAWGVVAGVLAALRRSAPWARGFRFPARRWEELAPVGRSYMGVLFCRVRGRRGFSFSLREKGSVGASGTFSRGETEAGLPGHAAPAGGARSGYFCCARICASTAASAVMLTTRRGVALLVRMCTGLEMPIRIGPMATPSVITRTRL